MAPEPPNDDQLRRGPKAHWMRPQSKPHPEGPNCPGLESAESGNPEFQHSAMGAPSLQLLAESKPQKGPCATSSNWGLAPEPIPHNASFRAVLAG
eukprot:653245-Alexandrium_andersonii.AAC.1